MRSLGRASWDDGRRLAMHSARVKYRAVSFAARNRLHIAVGGNRGLAGVKDNI